MTDPELREALEGGDLIVCVGASPSIAAGLPDGTGLARGLLEHAARVDASIDVVSLTSWLEQRPGDVLEQLHHKLGAEFQREVERRLSDQGRAVPRLAHALAALRPQLKAIYTTRLDRVVERALAGRWPSFAHATPGLAQRSKVVFKIRGTLEFHQSWVVTREQQERELGPGAPRRRVFESAFAANRILFVGFEGDRVELRWLLDLLPTQTDGLGPSHIIALPACSPDERQQLERRGLRVIDQDPLSLLEGLAGGGAVDTVAPPVSTHACPYPGLESFSESLSDVFFGRHAEVSEATARLGTQGDTDRRWLAVEGPSGVGKSSFVRAGVLPALRHGFAEGTPAHWRVAVMRPGAAPQTNLSDAVALALGIEDRAYVQRAIAEHPGGLLQLLRHRVHEGEGFLLVVDQLEETVTMAQGPQRDGFAAAVASALDARALYLVTTARSDFIPALQRDLPALVGRLNDAAERYSLPPISRAGLREAICEPAARLSVAIEPALVERLLLDSGERAASGEEAEARTAEAALPLVAHVLRGLWTYEHLQDGVIALDEYLALGGISGALSRGADAALAALDEAGREQARALLLALVHLEPDGTPTRRVLDVAEARTMANDHVLAQLSGGHAAAAVRLVVMREDDGRQEIELVHEALIRDWAALRGWIEQERGSLLLAEDLARRAEQWDARGRDAERLPVAAEARELLSVTPHGHSRAQQQQFQAAMRRAMGRRRLATVGGIVAALVVVLGVGAFVTFGLDHDVPDVGVVARGGPERRATAEDGPASASAVDESAPPAVAAVVEPGTPSPAEPEAPPADPAKPTDEDAGDGPSEPETNDKGGAGGGKPSGGGGKSSGGGGKPSGGGGSPPSDDDDDDGKPPESPDDDDDDVQPPPPPPPPPPKKPTVKLGLTPKGELTKKAARGVVKPTLSKVTKCYEKGLAKDSALEGTLIIKLSIFPGMGHIAGTTTVSNSLGSSPAKDDVRRCVVDVLDDLNFGEDIHFGDGLSVTFTMKPAS